jgi:tetratricopeptide (TPR) repeat protein
VKGRASPGYGYAAAAEILSVGEGRLRRWAKAGLVVPSRGDGRRPLFSFQDLVAAKATKELVERGFSTGRIRRALDAVRAQLPDLARPLDRLRLAWNGEALVVLDDAGAFELTGQRLFDFGLGELKARASSIDDATPIGRPRAAGRGKGTGARATAAAAEKGAFDWLAAGLRAEREGREEEATAAYRKALKADPGLAAAHTNLGGLAHRRGELAEARACFEAALAVDPEQPEARYNLACLLFEAGDAELAAAEWRRVLQLRPDFADAHYNLATALERLGGRRQAREHLLRYLELVAEHPGEPGQAGETGEEPAWAAEARARLSRLA